MTSADALQVLVVEDEILVSLMLEDMLADLDCKVGGSARSVAEALALLGGEEFDAAILDLNLGGETAYPVADALGARGIPFVFLTGYGAGGIEPRFAGVPTIAKPFTLIALEKAVQYFTSVVSGF